MINFSKNVFFIPYKGSKYEQGYKNKRILVLGESHYCADDDGCTDIEKYPEWETDCSQPTVLYLLLRWKR